MPKMANLAKEVTREIKMFRGLPASYTYHTVCTTIRHIMGTGRSSAATSHVRPNKLSAGILAPDASLVPRRVKTNEVTAPTPNERVKRIPNDADVEREKSLVVTVNGSTIYYENFTLTFNLGVRPMHFHFAPPPRAAAGNRPRFRRAPL